MVWVDSINDLEYYHSNPDWGCYADLVTTPSDITLQAQLGTRFDGTISGGLIRLLAPDGTLLTADITSYFRLCYISHTIGGVTYFYVNIRLKRYSPAMLTNICFVLDVQISDGSGVLFHKYTQKYQILNADIYPADVVVSYAGETDNLATLCSTQTYAGVCNPIIKLTSLFDCVDAFTGDFYGDGVFLGGSTTVPFTYARFCWMEAMVRKLPTNIKRTVSINCRTQRTERTDKHVLTAFKPFPLWKMEEIEGMLMCQHLFIDDREYQSEGGTPFEQFGQPKNCVYMYKMAMELQDCFKFQMFGCTPPCTPAIFYYPIAF